MKNLSGAVTSSVVSGIALVILTRTPKASRFARWALRGSAVFGMAVTANELSGRPVLLLRWSMLRFLLGQRRMQKEWQVGDGREKALAAHVVRNARQGDIDDVIRVIDDFCYNSSFMINVGDEKGEILDRAVRRVQPQRILELGAYCGYSALRMVRVMPSNAHLYSVEFSPANAQIARRIWDHAGVGDRVTVVVGHLGDGGVTLNRLRTEHDFTDGGLDFVFVDHDKSAYLPDLQRILSQGWLHPSSVVVADNVKVPGAPEYRAYLREQEGKSWRTTEHQTHFEYQSLITDLVLDSEYLSGPR